MTRQIFLDGSQIIRAETVHGDHPTTGQSIPDNSPSNSDIITLYWWDNSELTLRPQMNISTDKTAISADGTDTATISNCPNGSEVLMNGVSSGVVSDNTVEITSSVPKVLNIEIVLFPYINGEAIINVS